MTIARSVAEALSEHTTLELECIDRMYLNVYVPMLQTGAGTAHFFRCARHGAQRRDWRCSSTRGGGWMTWW